MHLDKDVSLKTHKVKRASDKRRGKKKSTAKIVVIVIASILAVLIIGAVILWNYLFGKMHHKNLNASDSELGINAGTVEEKKSITNIALFGVDSRSNTFKGNSDVIMILSIDEINNKVKMVSVARDSYVPIDDHGRCKINAAYSYGGAKLAIKTLNQNYNLNIRDYATVNFGSMAKIIDKFDGVDIELTKKELDYLNSPDCRSEVPKKLVPGADGKCHLNGRAAVMYARIRYIDSDFARGDRQKNVLDELFNKALNMPKTSYPSLVSELSEYVETSLSNTQIIGMIPALIARPSIVKESLPYGAIHGKGWVSETAPIWGSIVAYDLDRAADMLDKLINQDITFEDYDDYMKKKDPNYDPDKFVKNYNREVYLSDNYNKNSFNKNTTNKNSTKTNSSSKDTDTKNGGGLVIIH